MITPGLFYLVLYEQFDDHLLTFIACNNKWLPIFQTAEPLRLGGCLALALYVDLETSDP